MVRQRGEGSGSCPCPPPPPPAAAGFLPSSFTMCALTAAAAAMLEGRPYAAIVAAVVGECMERMRGLLAPACPALYFIAPSGPLWPCQQLLPASGLRRPCTSACCCAALRVLAAQAPRSPATPPPPFAAAAGVVWGWCVAGFAFLPFALYVLAAAPLLPAVGTLLLCLLCTLGPLALVDRRYYGRWTVGDVSSDPCVAETGEPWLV